MKALLRPAVVFGLSIAIAVTSLVGSSSVALAAGPVITSLELVGGTVVYEGARPSLTGTFTGGAGHGPYMVWVDWNGDFDFEDVFSFDTLDGGTFTVQKTDPYANEQADITIIVAFEDESGVHTKNYPAVGQPRVTVLDTPPTVDSFTLSATQIDEGGAVTSTVVFTDGGAADRHTVTVDWNDGSAVTTTTLDVGARTFTTDPHTYAGSGEYTVSAIVTQTDTGAWSPATASLSVRVPNQAPTVSLNLTVGTEGASSSLAVTFADADALDTHNVSVAWGDGQTTDSGTLAADVTTFDATHVYADNGNYSLVLTLTDSATPAHSVTETRSVSPANVDPAVGSLALSPNPAVDHQDVTLTGSVTDPGTADTFTFTVDWGDGSSSPEAPVAADRSFSAVHAYSAAGTFTVTATVTDRDGGRSSSTASIEVQPSQGTSAADVIDEMILFVRSFELDRNTERWLVKKLEDLKASLAYGNDEVCSFNGGLAHILSFSGRTLSDEQHATLNTLVARLDAAAGCNGTASQLPKVQGAATVTTTVTPAPSQKEDTTAKETAKATKSNSKPTEKRGKSH